MQTFMTRMTYTRTAEDLDDARLGKQRIEALQTLNQIAFGEGGYKHHPVNLMWQYNPLSLAAYAMVMCKEWTFKRGFLDTRLSKIQRVAQALIDEGYKPGDPAWLGDKDVLRSHRSNLVRKNPDRYGEMFPGTPDDLPYLWPSVQEDGSYLLLLSKADKRRIEDKTRSLPESIAERVDNLD